MISELQNKTPVNWDWGILSFF